MSRAPKAVPEVFIPLDVGRLPVTPGWAESALCAQTDPDAWFPDKGDSTKAVKRTCARCEVRLDCLHDALNTGETEFGVRAGYSARELHRMRMEARRPLDDDLDGPAGTNPIGQAGAA
jgi:Transcription factor WhiB